MYWFYVYDTTYATCELLKKVSRRICPILGKNPPGKTGDFSHKLFMNALANSCQKHTKFHTKVVASFSSFLCTWLF